MQMIKVRPKIKVCGMREAENILELSQFDIDYVGFIFYKESPRFVGDSFVVPEALPSEIKKVGVFVNEDTEVMLKLVDRHQLDYVQLHGDESAEVCEMLKHSGIGVIKAFGVKRDFDFKRTDAYSRSVDYFLFDTAGEKRGGTGASFDWNVLGMYSGTIPYFLSGGIDHHSIDLIKKLNDSKIYAIDVNSKLEVRPGIKDVEKVEEFVNAKKRAYEI